MEKDPGSQIPDFIPGIYNFCDRWCERCMFTHRCMSFMFEAEKEDRALYPTEDNEQFWEEIENVLQATLRLVREIADDMGISTEGLEEAEPSASPNAPQFQLLLEMAQDYGDQVAEWFVMFEEIHRQLVHSFQEQIRLGLPGAKQSSEQTLSEIQEWVEVIRWYQHQIYVKFRRAVSSQNQEIEMADFWTEEAPMLKDSEGSAKVALIAVDRSLAAWGKLSDFFPDHSDLILNLLVSLERIRNQGELLFPMARTFVRPGFDTEG